MKRSCSIAALSSLLLFSACSAPPERVFQEFELEEITPLLPPDSLHWPGATRLTEHGVFVIEYSDAHVWLYDFDGNLVQTFGAGKGEGPGEMLNPIDMVVLGDTVAVLDAYSRSVHRFLVDGSYVESDGMDTQGSRMSSSRSTTLILGTNPEHLFIRYPFVEGDSSAALFQGLGIMQAPQVLGIFTSDEDHFVYASYFRPFFAVLSHTGEVLFARTTIDDGAIDEPDMSVSDEGVARFPPPLNRGVSVSNGRLYVENGPMRTDSSSVLDVYDLEEKGAYLYSLLMPFRSSSVSIRGNMMTARTGQVTASLFRFEVEE